MEQQLGVMKALLNSLNDFKKRTMTAVQLTAKWKECRLIELMELMIIQGKNFANYHKEMITLEC